MRVLNISNHSALRCGIQNFGAQMTTALRRAGCTVTDWDACWPVLHARTERGEPDYLPDDVMAYDVIHVNWHPASNNIYLDRHFPAAVVRNGNAGRDEPPYVRRPILSVYLNDIPPWSGCPFVHRADVVLAAEPFDERILGVGAEVAIIPYPVVDWVEDLPAPNAEFTVGWTGVRGDGVSEIITACLHHEWKMNGSNAGGPWLSIEDEVRRLARSTVNVCWYHEGRGIAGASSTCLASKRPLVINHSPMLRHLVGLPGWQVLVADECYSLDAALAALESAWSPLRRWPTYTETTARFAWTSGAQQMIATWKEAMRA